MHDVSTRVDKSLFASPLVLQWGDSTSDTTVMNTYIRSVIDVPLSAATPGPCYLLEVAKRHVDSEVHINVTFPPCVDFVAHVME